MDNEKFQDLMLEHFGKVLNELAGVKQDVAEVKRSQVRMEQEFGKKLDVLYYDWRETQKQFNEEVKRDIKVLCTKVEALQMESNKHDREIKDLYLVNQSRNK
ncbi:MAG: hypothetical protein AB7E31_08910 [Desulfitobacterium sp.]